MPEEYIDCYFGEVPKPSYDGIDRGNMSFIYNHETKVVVLGCLKGTTIDAHKFDRENEDYLEGEKRRVKKSDFESLVDSCVELSSLKDTLFSDFGRITENSKV